MIKYKLKCKDPFCHEKEDFDGWFQNIESFEKQKRMGLINCPICGSDNVVKSLTTPSLRKKQNNFSSQLRIKNKSDLKNTKKIFEGNENINNFTTILRSIKKEIQKNSTFVGEDFVNQARSMKQGKITEKPIYGHGTSKEIEELREEGVKILNIPWVPDDH